MTFRLALPNIRSPQRRPKSLCYGLLSGDADGARTHDLLRDRQWTTLMNKGLAGVFYGLLPVVYQVEAEQHDRR